MEGERVAGIIWKDDVEEKMSDLSVTNVVQRPPVVKISGLDQLIELYQAEGVKVENEKVLPVVDEQGGFVGLWNRAQLVRVWERMPEVKKWAPPAVSISVPEMAEAGIKAMSAKRVMPKHIAGKAEQQRAKLHQEEISVLALEALPIPLLAVDTSGNVLFYNQDWRATVKLDVSLVMKTARSVMADRAFSGDIGVDSIFDLDGLAENVLIKMKAMTVTSKDNVGRERAMGYLFWVEEGESFGASEAESKRSERVAAFDEFDTKRFQGRTFHEIMIEEEKRVLAWAMDETGDNQSNAAMLLGLPRQTFSYRYKKLFKNS